jgi:hypothetical protein
MSGFSLEIRMQLYMAAGCICMREGCNNKLVAPTTPGKQLIIGEGAHIVSGATNGPRHRVLDDYDTFENGIALCANCHREVDNRQLVGTYTENVLRAWKAQAVVAASQGIGKPVVTGGFNRREEWAIVDGFREKLGTLLTELWPFTEGWEISDDGLNQISAGSRGFDPFSRWGQRHPLRSVDPGYAPRQDAIIECLETLQAIIRRKKWDYSGTNTPRIKRFLPELTIRSNEDREYAAEIANGIAGFKRLAREFISSH